MSSLTARQGLLILIVDDDEVMRKLLREVLEKEGYEIELASSGEEAVRFLASKTYSVIVSDIRMLELDGMSVLRAAKKSDPKTVVVLMTGFGSMEGAMEAIREGAFDYVSKPFKMSELKTVVARATRQWESLQSAAMNHENLASPVAPPRTLIGKSAKIIEVYKSVARATLVQSHVLLLGESGSGKKRVARSIHENSERRTHPWVVMSGDIESESQFEIDLLSTQGGTLYLENIEALPLHLQSRLARVLSDQELKLSSTGEVRKLDIRVIASSEARAGRSIYADIEEQVKLGRLREDLYFKLKVITIELPPLRERREDIPELVSHFLAFYAEKNHKSVSHVDEKALQQLTLYPWPGNVRELEHAIEHAVAFSNQRILMLEDFPSEVRGYVSSISSDSQGSVMLPAVGTQQGSLEDLERAHILRVLQETQYNKSKASEILGIDRATLYRKAQRYGIDLRGKA